MVTYVRLGDVINSTSLKPLVSPNVFHLCCNKKYAVPQIFRNMLQAQLRWLRALNQRDLSDTTRCYDLDKSISSTFPEDDDEKKKLY